MGIDSHTAASSSRFGEKLRWLMPSIFNLIAATDIGAMARIVNAVFFRALAAFRAATLVIGLFFLPPVFYAIDTIANTVTLPVPANIGNLISTAQGQPAAPTQSQS